MINNIKLILVKIMRALQLTTTSKSSNEERLFLLFFYVVFCCGFFLNAWIAEDAFINFRVIRNFLDGHGFVWNIGERVQVFTSPLWMLLTAASSALTGELFYTTIAVSFVCTSATLVILYYCSQGNSIFFIVATSFLLARCIIDYSSSGLETPLLLLTLSAFIYAWCRPDSSKKKTFFLTLLASMCALTRHDTVFLTAPFVVLHLLKSISDLTAKVFIQQAKQIFIGATPLCAWTLFSIIYYGSAFPNTANAKIISNLQQFDPIEQAISYFQYSQHFDLIGFWIIILTVFTSALFKTHHFTPFIISLSLFILYIFFIGGDYMAGRFMIGPVILSSMIIADILAKIFSKPIYSFYDKKICREIYLALIFAPLLALSLKAFSSINDCSYSIPVILDGIADERSIYYGHTDFLSVAFFKINHPFKTTGEMIKNVIDSKKEIVIACNIGMVGYYAGKDTYIVDPIALSDSFLARLPIRDGIQRVGHFERYVPREYIESIIKGINYFSHPLVKMYYEDILQVTRKPLISIDRLHAILRLNTGYYRELKKISISDMGGPLLIDGDVNFVMHSCLGGKKTPVYIVGEKGLASNRIKPFTVSY